MELGKHLGKGVWGLAGKALPVVYGLGYVLLVIRVLPEEEFGTFVLLQELFLVFTGLATAVALQPLVKFVSEHEADTRNVISASFLMHLGFLAGTAVLTVAAAAPLARLLNSRLFEPLAPFLALMLAASVVRNFALALLQAQLRLRDVFIVDALHFLGAPFLVWVLSRLHLFDTALDLVLINILSLSLSSLAGWVLIRKDIRFTLTAPRSEFGRLWVYGKYTLGGIVSTLIYTRFDSFILAGFSGPLAVAVYSAAKVFARIYEMTLQVVQMFVLPVASRLSSRGDTAALRSVTEKAITFTTVGMLPVFLLFLAAPDLLLGVLYAGRYTEAVPILRVFSLLALLVPLFAVGQNVLLGTGDARRNFVLGAQMLGVCLLGYLVLIPPWGGLGAAVAYVVATAVVTITTTAYLRRIVPVTPASLTARLSDIRGFLQSLPARFEGKR
jgi:O-antigen/teichoic acid export membrane protein